MFPVIRHPRLFCLTANEKDFSLSLEMTMREGGTLPPSLGRRCLDGAEARSLSGMKRNVRQSFHVSASHVVGCTVFLVIRHPRLFWLTANEKDFSLSLEMTMREGGILPPSPGRRCPEGAEVGFLSGMKGMRGGPLRVVIPSAAEGSFSFPFSGAGMYNKKEFIHAFFVRAVRGKR